MLAAVVDGPAVQVTGRQDDNIVKSDVEFLREKLRENIVIKLK